MIGSEAGAEESFGKNIYAYRVFYLLDCKVTVILFLKEVGF